jgi:NADH dehydrogenase
VVVKLIENKSMQAFEYNDKGSMATIGRNKAVVDLPKYHLVVFLHGLSDVCPLVFPYWIQKKAVVFLNWV